MKKRIFRIIIFGMVIIMACSCDTKEKKAAEAETRAKEIEAGREDSLRKLTSLQKLIAEKAGYTKKVMFQMDIDVTKPVGAMDLEF